MTAVIIIITITSYIFEAVFRSRYISWHSISFFYYNTEKISHFCIKLDREQQLCAEKSELENVLHEKAEIIWSQFRYMLVTFNLVML